MTILQMANPKKTIGIVSLAVKPRDITDETVAANGGANISEHQYDQYSCEGSVSQGHAA
jgi:hypothetical protein